MEIYIISANFVVANLVMFFILLFDNVLFFISDQSYKNRVSMIIQKKLSMMTNRPV